MGHPRGGAQPPRFPLGSGMNGHRSGRGIGHIPSAKSITGARGVPYRETIYVPTFIRVFYGVP